MENGSEPEQRLKLCVVTYCFDEVEVIDEFHRQVSAVLASLDGVEARLIVVDDGSRDGTLERLNRIAARDARTHVYSLSRNFGPQVAISCGLDAAQGCDAVITLDSDLQHPPALLPALLDRYRMGFDIVFAVRRRTEGISRWKELGSRWFYWIFNRLSDTPIRPGAADFVLLSRRARDALISLPERRRFLRGMISWLGFPSSEVPYEAPPRFAGTTKYTPGRMLHLAFDALFSFSSAPIRLATRLGLAVAASGLAYLFYVVARAILLRDLVPGWASLICVVLVLGGVQLAFIGLIGEYIARIFDEAKGRPLYILKQSPTIGPFGAVADEAEVRNPSRR